MKATRQLLYIYRPEAELNLGRRRMILWMNGAGLIALFIFGRLFLELAFRIRPEISAPDLRQIIGGLNILGFIVALIATMVLHELVHGLFFWQYTRTRPKFGFNLLYAYAAAPGWYFPRNQFIWVGISPLVIITLVGVILIPFVPYGWVPLLLSVLILNAAGAVGDLWVVTWLAGRPANSFVHDQGPLMVVYLSQLPALKTQWQELLTRYGVTPEKAAAAFSRLVTEYETGERYYHNLLHIQHVLTVVDDLSAFATDPDVVRLAAWYHDAVYDSRRPDNEAKSAQFATDELTLLGIPAGVVTEVRRLILATAAYHLPTWEQAGREDHNAHVLLDADLSGLASPWEEFKYNGDNIYREFSWAASENFSQERQNILQQFLDRERIFYTPPMFANGEETARQNIRREIGNLQMGSLEGELFP